MAYTGVDIDINSEVPAIKVRVPKSLNKLIKERDLKAGRGYKFINEDGIIYLIKK